MWHSEDDPNIYVKNDLSSKHAKRMRNAQRLHRTDIKDWQKQNHAKRWLEVKQRLVWEATKSPKVIEQCSVEEFRERFEISELPCVITGCADDWKARCVKYEKERGENVACHVAFLNDKTISYQRSTKPNRWINLNRCLMSSYQCTFRLHRFKNL